MAATILDGNKIAAEIRAEVASEVKSLTSAGMRPGAGRFRPVARPRQGTIAGSARRRPSRRHGVNNRHGACYRSDR